MTNDFDRPAGSTPTGSTRWGSTWPAWAEEAETRRLLDYLEDRFGLPRSLFEPYGFFRARDSWRILRKSPHLEGARGLRVEAVGVRAFHEIGAFLKPTTRLIQAFGRHATRSRVEVTAEDLERLGRGEEIPSDSDAGDGYVLLVFEGQALGLGLLLRGTLRSQIPKSDARFLRDAETA